MPLLVKMMMWCCMIVMVAAATADRRSLPPTCDSLIYCYGPLLDTVQMAGLYNDSKTFVDMKIKVSAELTMEHFRKMMNETESHPTKADIMEFVLQNFDPEGSEFEAWTPDDWKDSPAFLGLIQDPQLKEWAGELHRLWLHLGRKMTKDVEKNQDLYSILYVKHPVIVPGGRFREFYYWDSYWIIKGLLLSEMRATARGMVSNFLDIVDRIGFIPNGGRIYYIMRSQPPLLIPMMQAVMKDNDDVEFLTQRIHTLDREFDFWMNNHTVNVTQDSTTYKMLRYNDMSQGPRPESYKEDVDVARHFDNDEKKEELYAELKAAAESGWDFSSRWFILNGTNKDTERTSWPRKIYEVSRYLRVQANLHHAIAVSTVVETFGNNRLDIALIQEPWLNAGCMIADLNKVGKMLADEKGLTAQALHGNLTHLKTRSIIPVDLNAIVCWNAEIMRDFHTKLGNIGKAEYYKGVHARLMEAIEKVLWHEDVGAWLDFSLESGRRRDYFYPTNVAPLWTGSYDQARKEYYVSRVINYLDISKVDIYQGGIPTTFEHSGEQWDYPNAWPPLQYIVVEGLASTGHPGAMRLASEMATKWVRSNFVVWTQKNAMLEKYDATIFGGFGGGGEYALQTGFGWTNGVIMELLTKYGGTLSATDAFGAGDSGAVAAQVGAGGVATSLLVLLASLAAGTLGYQFYLELLCDSHEAQYQVASSSPKSTRSLHYSLSRLIRHPREDMEWHYSNPTPHRLMMYRKRHDYTPLSTSETVSFISRPYTELRSMNISNTRIR